MAEKVILEVEVKSSKSAKDIKKVGDGSKQAAKETTLLSGAMGGVRTAMIAMKATSKLLFGSMKAGLISTGLGIFVVLIGSLVSYLMNTKKGAEKLEQVLAGVGAIISVLTDRISMIGGAIAKVFSGDFAGAAADVKGALSGIGDEIIAEANAAMRLKEELQALKDATRELSLEKAQATQEIEKAMLITVDETKTNDEKLAALKRALELEKDVTEQSLALQQRRVAAIEEEVSLGESLEADFQALTDERIRLIELETASIKMQKKVATQVLAFERKIEGEKTAARKRGSDRRKRIREQEAKDAAKLAKDLADAEIKLANNTAKLLETLALKAEDDAEIREYEALKNKWRADKIAIKNSIAGEDEKLEALRVLKDIYWYDQVAIEDKYDAILEARELKASDRLIDLTNETSLSLEENLNTRALMEIEIERSKELASVQESENSASIKAEINTTGSK
jgi:hypothetical protein